MNTKVNILGVKALNKAEFYLEVETAIVPMFSKIFPESVGKFSIDVTDHRQLEILDREICSIIHSIADKKNIKLSVSYLKNIQNHFMNRFVFYDNNDNLYMNSMYTVEFMTHYQMFRYLSEWIMTRLKLFTGLTKQQFSQEVLQHARMTNNTLSYSIQDKAIIEICSAISNQYFDDIKQQDARNADHIQIQLLVPDYEYNTVHKEYPNDARHEEYIDWAFAAVRSIYGIKFIEEEMKRNNNGVSDIEAVMFYIQTFLDGEYFELPFIARMAYKRRFTLSAHMIISESARLDTTGYLSILSPDGGYSKLKSKSIPEFLFLRCFNDNLLNSYSDSKSEVFRDMVRLKLMEFNMLRQDPLDNKLLKKHFEKTIEMLANPNKHKTSSGLMFKPDQIMINNMISIMKDNKGAAFK